MESSPPADCPGDGGCRPIHSNSGLALMGEVLSYGFGFLSYDLAFLSYVFRVVSYGFRFLSYERTSPPALTIRKVHSNGKQSASGLPRGGSCRPIHSNSGLILMDEVLSYDFGLLSYDFAFLSYVFRVVSYVFQVLSYDFRLLSHEHPLPLP